MTPSAVTEAGAHARDTPEAPRASAEAAARAARAAARAARRRESPGAPRPFGRAFWLKHLHRWHWISAAISLVGMILFAATGITLNHAAEIEAKPVVVTRTATLPAALLAALPAVTAEEEVRPLPPALRTWLRAEFGIAAGDRAAEWTAAEIHLPLPRPGGDAALTIERETGLATHEVTTRGWVSYLNDLHKGRHTGPAWSWFLDIFAVACLLFCVTGLWLLHLHGRNRPATWPLVGLGLAVPVVLLLLFIH